MDAYSLPSVTEKFPVEILSLQVYKLLLGETGGIRLSDVYCWKDTIYTIA